MQVDGDKALALLLSNETAWHDERAKLVLETDTCKSKELEYESRVKEMLSDTERLWDVISKLDAPISSLEQYISKKSLISEVVIGYLVIDRAEVERMKRDSYSPSDPFEAILAAKDATIAELRNHDRN